MSDDVGAEVHDRIARLAGLQSGQLPEHTPARELVSDSIGLVELLVDVEEEFGVRLMQADLGSMSTVADLVTLIHDRQGVGE